MCWEFPGVCGLSEALSNVMFYFGTMQHVLDDSGRLAANAL